MIYLLTLNSAIGLATWYYVVTRVLSRITLAGMVALPLCLFLGVVATLAALVSFGDDIVLWEEK